MNPDSSVYDVSPICTMLKTHTHKSLCSRQKCSSKFIPRGDPKALMTSGVGLCWEPHTFNFKISVGPRCIHSNFILRNIAFAIVNRTQKIYNPGIVFIVCIGIIFSGK